MGVVATMAGIPPLLLLLLHMFLPCIQTYEFHPIQVVETINVNPMENSMQNLESMAVREEYKRPKWTAKTYKSVVKSEDAAGDVGFFLPIEVLTSLMIQATYFLSLPKLLIFSQRREAINLRKIISHLKKIILKEMKTNHHLRKITSPKRNINHPKRNISHPKTNINPPKRNINNHKKNISHLKRNINHLKKNIKHPKKNINHPNKNINLLKKNINHPKKSIN